MSTPTLDREAIEAPSAETIAKSGFGQPLDPLLKMALTGEADEDLDLPNLGDEVPPEEPLPTDETPAETETETATEQPKERPSKENFIPQSRLNEVVAEREAAILAQQTLQAELDAERQGAPIKLANTDGKFNAIFQVDKLEETVATEESKIQAWIDVATDNREGGLIKTPDGQTKEYTREQISDLLANNRGLLRNLKTEYAQAKGRISQDESTIAQAREKFPYLFDPSKPEYAEALRIKRENPEIVLRPGWRLRIGEIIEGRKAITGRTVAKVIPKAGQPGNRKQPSAPPLPTNPGADRGREQPKTFHKMSDQDRGEMLMNSAKGSSLWKNL